MALNRKFPFEISYLLTSDSVSGVLALQRNNLDLMDHFIMSEDKLKAQGMFLELLFGQERQEKLASASIQ